MVYDTPAPAKAHAVAVGGSVVFHQTDHLSGSNIDTDENGNIVEVLDYYPYGDVRLDEKSVGYENDYKYTGKELDDETDLYYYGARYYDAKIGRFVSVDPWSGDLSDPQSFNKYSYVRNNPLKYTDPSGEFFFLAAPLVVWAGEAIIGLAAVSGSAIMVSMMAENAVTNYNTATNWSSASTLDKALLVADAALTAVAVSGPVKQMMQKSDEVIDEARPVAQGFVKRLEAQLEKGKEWLNKGEKVHGNSLNSTAENTGYTLRNKDTGEVIKYGETIHPDSRYSQKYLKENNARFQEEVSGSKQEIHQWQHEQIVNYKNHNNGQRPALNKSDW